MKASFNQLHNWKQTSEYWRLINNIPDNKRNLEINYKDWGRSPYINVLWHKISKEFTNKFGSEFAFRETFDLFTGKKAGNCYQYPYVYIHTSFCSCLKHEITFTINGIRFENGKNWFSITPKNNILITKEYIKRLVFEYINKNILYPIGFFRDIQQAKNCTKDQVKIYYKNYIESQKETDLYDYDIEKYFARRYRIVPADTLTTDWNEFALLCINYIKINGKPKELKTVCKMDTSGLLDHYDGDDFFEIEDLFYERQNEYGDNVILI